MTDQPHDPEPRGFDAGSPASIDQARLDANWRAIEIELDLPAPSRIERWLRRVGVPSHTTRLALATPALRRSWYLAVAGAVFVALAAADPDAPRQSVLLWLVIAPLVGVLGVAMAYGPSSDAAHELHLATPTPGLKVLAVRTLAVLATSTSIITVFALLNSVTRPFAAAWFLPALAVTGSALAVMTVFPPRRAATLTAVVWCTVVAVSQAGSDPLAVFTPVGQIVAAAVAATSGVIVIRRRGAFDQLVMAA